MESLLDAGILYPDLKAVMKKTFQKSFDPEERLSDLKHYLSKKKPERFTQDFMSKVMDHFEEVFEAEGIEFMTIEPTRSELEGTDVSVFPFTNISSSCVEQSFAVRYKLVAQGFLFYTFSENSRAPGAHFA